MPRAVSAVCSALVLVGTRPVTHVVDGTESPAKLAIVGPYPAIETILQPQHPHARHRAHARQACSHHGALSPGGGQTTNHTHYII
eukprot:scaffold15035_cov72-Phaeocystis_antarctica.AAC.2